MNIVTRSNNSNKLIDSERDTTRGCAPSRWGTTASTFALDT
jgi:hypothetical protein